MGAALGCLASEAACCFTSATCRCIGKAVSSSTVTRSSYALLFLCNTVIAWVLLSDFFSQELKNITHGYLELKCPEGECYGVLAVQRMCFAMTVFHLVLSGLLVGVQNSKETRAGIQNGWWAPKVFSWIALAVTSFFIPNQFFMFWGHYVALIGAMIFILLQILFLIDFTHTFSESLLVRYEESQSKGWLTVLVSSALSLIIMAIVMMGLMYAYFGGSECGLNRFFITFNLILTFACIMFSLAPQVQQANSQSGLMQPSIIVAYMTYLVLSAVANEPESSCNPMYAHKGTQTLAVVVGTIFTFIAITYSTSSAAVKAKNLMAQDSEEQAPLVSDQPRRRAALLSAVAEGALPSSAINEFDADQERLGQENDEVDGVAYNYSYFHLIFAMAAMYVAMLLTNWNVVTEVASDESSQGVLAEIGKSWAAVWVKVISSWLVVLLYSWTLWAPVWFPDRDWST